ncbi:MAG: hypothetical protein KAY46_14195, partial [Burkholderiaceae bacterium]|nr:hypothetical protein [Burkholderiaceae bacterium]
MRLAHVDRLRGSAAGGRASAPTLAALRLADPAEGPFSGHARGRELCLRPGHTPYHRSPRGDWKGQRTMRDTDARAVDAAADAAGNRQSYSSLVWGYRQAEAVAAMIYVGRELGLFKAMADAGPLSAEALAAKTGLHPRWLLEWMRLQAAAKILVYQPVDRFILPAQANDLLANDASRAYAADSFSGGYPPEQIAGLIESFRTGIGKTYESDGPHAVTKSEARHIKTAQNQVLPVMIPALTGVQEKLQQGARVADVGCGDGALAVALAKAFPASVIHAMIPIRPRSRMSTRRRASPPRT